VNLRVVGTVAMKFDLLVEDFSQLNFFVFVFNLAATTAAWNDY
jgi:hypothetical protein